MQAEFYIENFAVIGPGFQNKFEFAEKLTQGIDVNDEFIIPKINNLSKTILRRASRTIKLALAVAAQAKMESQFAQQDVTSIFASSQGDTDIMHYLGDVLALPDRPISPAKFHNSLHNAASGYWHINGNDQKSSMAITAGQDTFVTGLLEACQHCEYHQHPVLFVAYDIEVIDELKAFVQIKKSFASALLITPNKTASSIARVAIALTKQQAELENNISAKLAAANPIARSLPLLALLAEKKDADININYLSNQNVQINVENYHEKL